MASGVVTPDAVAGDTRVGANAGFASGARWETIARWLSWGAFIAILVGGALAPVLRTGDAHQYYAMATALAEWRPPALTAEEVTAFKQWLEEQPADAGFASSARAVEQPPLVVAGRQEFSHFWFYPLLAAPFVVVTGPLELHPGYAFFIVNALLLGVAIWMVQRAFSPVVSLLLLASPVIWFVNKAQVEIFTFSLLCMAMAEARRGRYLWAGLATAIASTQNAPIAAAVACFWAAALLRHVISRQRTPNSPQNWGAGGAVWEAVALIIATIIVAALHPLYYFWRLGVLTPQQLNGGIAGRLPSVEQYLAVLIDPDIGLLPWLPLYGLVAVVGLVFVCRPGGGVPLDLRLTAACGLIIGAWFLAVFAQTTNVNSGGTIHISRYALWLLPLGLPLLEATARWLQPRAPALLPIAGALAFASYAIYFQPAQAERYTTPSPQSALVTSWVPERYRTVPEIFYERRQQTDGGVRGSAATGDCRVILIEDGAQQSPCPLTPAEASEADGLLSGDWQAVWIVRPGPLGLGNGGVSGALPRR